MRRAVTVALKDLRLRLRDRSLLLIGVVAPLAITAIVGFALGSTSNFSTTIVFADADSTALSRQLGDVLSSKGFRDVADVHRAGSAAAARKDVERGKASVAIVVPAGFGAHVEAGRKAKVDVVGDPQAPVSTAVAVGVVQGYLARVQAGQIAVATATALAHHPPADPAALAESAARTLPAVEFRADTVTGQLDPVDYSAPGMGLMFLFFAVLYGAATVQAERRNHTFARLAVSPASPTEVLAGKLAALVVTGLLIMAVIVGSGALLYDVPWGDPVAVAALSVSTVLAGVGISSLIAALARSEEQVRSVGAAVIIVLAMVGGQFTSGGATVPVLSTLRLFTPNGQALVGFTDLMVAGGRGGLGTVAVPLAVTTVVGVAGIALLLARGRRVFQA